MAWFGADPGGANAFGVALLRPDGTFESEVVSCADDAIEWLRRKAVTVLAAGIDAPLWWSSGKSGDRAADQYLRRRFNIFGGTVQAANSLRGAVLIQGALLAMGLRRQSPKLPITEAHPKALLKALWPKLSKSDRPWKKIAKRFRLEGPEPKHDERQDKRDALLAAIAAREGSAGRWTRDLALCERLNGEQDPAAVPWGPVHYWWPEVVAEHT
jgi:predicted RNase H-like nuclease